MDTDDVIYIDCLIIWRCFAMQRLKLFVSSRLLKITRQPEEQIDMTKEAFNMVSWGGLEKS